MVNCNGCYRLFRFFFSLRGGLLGLCMVYITIMSWSFIVGMQPLLLKTYSFLFSENLTNVIAVYHVFGVFISAFAIIGVLFDEKRFILPLLVVDSVLFIAYILTFGYLIQTKSSFLDSEKNTVKYIGQIGFGYFAVVLEYNVLRDLVKKTRARPQGLPESLIILPSASDSSRPINPRIILQQYRAERTEDDESDFHYVYGVSESMIRFLRTAPQSSGRPSTSTYSTSSSVPAAVLYNAESETILEAPPSPPELSAVFYSAQPESILQTPPPPYKP